MATGGRKAGQLYEGKRLNRVAFPLGGLGAGMICMEGTGAFSHVSLRHKPEVFNEPLILAALHVRGASPAARVLEGPVPMRKAFGEPGTANGGGGRAFGLPRFSRASFSSRFPFATVTMEDASMPVQVELTGWSPFVPGDADSSSLPVAGLEYRFANRSAKQVEAVFSFHATNFMKVEKKPGASVQPMKNGFILSQPPGDGTPWDEGHFALFTDETAKVDCAWFRGGWYDPLTMAWNAVMAGNVVSRKPHPVGDPGSGGSLYVPFRLKAGATKTIRIRMAWYVPASQMRIGREEVPAPAESCGGGCSCGDKPAAPEGYRPWYAGKFKTIQAVTRCWTKNYDRLRSESETFSECLYDTSFPAEVVESIAANLAILKSPTCLRQVDGRFWGWEGCCDASGCCHGSCTHVWNYAQAIPHLFPALERSLRESEFGPSQNEEGHQNFRTSLPIREPDHDFHAAADGQLGGLMKLYREWRISGNTAWMKTLWPRARKSLDYCIAQWDPDHTGTLIEPHHNTYDIEFWGADGMCTSFYLGALQAAILMGRAAGAEVSLFETLRDRGRAAMESALWNGEYFFQKVQWKGLRAGDPTTFKKINSTHDAAPEARAIVAKEGPKYQYGTGCLSDGVLGDWLARCCGLPPVLDEDKITRHVTAVFKHNFRRSLADHSNPQRPSFALGDESGLLLCSWPRGNKPLLPFVYSDEVWTGIEYAVASHLMMMGRGKEGVVVARAVRGRYDGSVRNPFDEYECGHWYARAMSSYAMLQGLTGARYDAVDRVLHLSPRVKGDFRAFLCTATGYGTVGVRRGKPFIEVKSGRIAVDRIDYRP